MITARCFSFEKEVQLQDKPLPENVFAASVNQGLIYEGVKSQLGNRRQGTASSKTRGEVRGTTKKPWTQKKTGRARAGSAKSPLWRGGGITFGPRPRDYTTLMPKKMRRAAMISLFSHLAGEGRISVLQDIDLKEYKTAKVKSVLLLVAAGLFETAQLLAKSNYVQKKTVLVLSSKGDVGDYYPYLRKSAQNLGWVTPVNVDSLEMKDMFYARSLVFTDVALAGLISRLSISVERGSKARAPQKSDSKVAQEVRS